MAQRTRIRLGTMRLRVRSLASLRGLKIRHCCELCCRSQMQLGSCVAVAVVQAGGQSSDRTPSLGPSICHGFGPKKTKQNKTPSALVTNSPHGLLCCPSPPPPPPPQSHRIQAALRKASAVRIASFSSVPARLPPWPLTSSSLTAARAALPVSLSWTGSSTPLTAACWPFFSFICHTIMDQNDPCPKIPDQPLVQLWIVQQNKNKIVVHTSWELE